MKFCVFITSLLIAVGCSSQVEVDANKQIKSIKHKSIITKTNWNHGSPNCDTNQEPAIDVYKHDEDSFIIRQNKCLTFEAPFIYILVGKRKVLVLDTGALGEDSEFSLYTELENILGKTQLSKREILVVHSHGHGDHYKGDADFDGRSSVRLIKTSAADVNEFFGFTQWPQGQKTIDLGERKITVIPTPGHQEEAISIYDHQTKWLMTGDTLYPGYIYVKDWEAYRNSIDRLATFASNNKVAAIFGAHIEMKNQARLYYAIGSTYQPNEAQLDLSVERLQALNTELKKSDKPHEIIFDDFIIKPMSGFQKTLSNAARWITQ